MKDKGTDITIARYISESEKLAPQNEKLNSALLEVVLHLLNILGMNVIMAALGITGSVSLLDMI